MTASELQLLRDIAAYLRTLTPGTVNRALLVRIDAALGLTTDIPASSRISVENPVRF
jgi:hypothetical protein